MVKIRKVIVEKDRLSELPDSVRLHILSLLCNIKEIARTSVLSTRWRSLWKYVPISLHFYKDGNDQDSSCVNKVLLDSRSFQKIQKFSVDFCYNECHAPDVDLWIYFATQSAVVEDCRLRLDCSDECYSYVEYLSYEFPQFAFKNSSLKNLVLSYCKVNPFGSVSWTSLISLSIGNVELTDEVMEKILSGCPNLEFLQLDWVWGLHRLDISSKKLTTLILKNPGDELLEILVPYVQNLQIRGKYCRMTMLLRNVASLVTAVLEFEPSLWYEDIEDKLERVSCCFKELLHSVAHVENLELGPYCVELLSVLELKGLPSPPSSRKFLKLNTSLEQLDFLGICSLLHSSVDLETMVIDWENHQSRTLLSRFTNENEDARSFHKQGCLLHLKIIKIIHFHGPLSTNRFVLPLVKYLLENAKVLEKLVIVAKFEGSDVSRDYVEMAEEFLSFPRSSPHASVVFSHQQSLARFILY